MLYTGCYCFEALVSLVPLALAIGLYLEWELWVVLAISILVVLFLVVSTIFFWKYTVKYKDAFFDTLKGKNKGNVDCDNPDIIASPKATDHCPFYKKYGTRLKHYDFFNEMLKRAPMAFEVSYIYLCPDSLTIFKGCAKYHLFIDDAKIVKKGFKKIKKLKDSCGSIEEIYYYHIMYAKLEGGKSIVLYLVDGSTYTIDGNAAVIAKIRARLRAVVKRKTVHQYEKPFVVSVRKHTPKEA